MDLRTRYVVKGIGKEQIIDSKINIFYDKASGKITKVEDKWDGNLPDSSFKDVSIDRLFSPWWWVHYVESWGWWGWSFTWGTLPWQVCTVVVEHMMHCNTLRMMTYADKSSQQALRKLNAVTVPKIVSVPKSDEEDAKLGNQ